jgi:SAM-dependent methyltransferase
VGDPADALVAPAVARNREPILSVLRGVLPARGLVLEVASGTGEHAAFFAAALPDLVWQPSDPDPDHRRSIAAHRALSGLPNLRSPLELDAAAPEWPADRAGAVVAINMVHIAPWAATAGLMAGAGRILGEGGLLFLYGPFKEGGAHTAPSNAAFDESLRARDPEWGVRDREVVEAEADRRGLVLAERVAMPANNLSLIFRRAGGRPGTTLPPTSSS